MKRYHLLPRWLRILLPLTFLSLCGSINAIAVREIVQSLQTTSSTHSLGNTAKSSQTRTALSGALKTFSNDSRQGSEGAIADSAHTDSDQTKQPSSVSKTSNRTDTPLASASASETQPNTQQSESLPVQPLYGHYPYEASKPADMALIASYSEGDRQRPEMLHPEAAKALHNMVSAARTAGIWLVPVSGYRTLAQQRTLFNAQIMQKGSPEAAAIVSAPPGYSEHHTGYAVDLTSGTLPHEQDISIAFAQTPAFAWLQTNAATYGFELSFPEDNAQGIAFEPWHWRYIGSPNAKAAFNR